MDYLGINIEGPSGEGFFFYPVYRTHGDEGIALGSGGGKSPRIYPDRKVHDWFLRYDPEGAKKLLLQEFQLVRTRLEKEKTKAADGPKEVKLSDTLGKQQTVLLFFRGRW